MKENELRSRETSLNEQINFLAEIKKPVREAEIGEISFPAREPISDMLEECRSLINEGKFEEAKEIYKQLGQKYKTLRINTEEKKKIYIRIYELYDDINIGMLANE